MKQIPMCWKCDKAITKPTTDDLFPLVSQKELTGCQACDTIKSYADAMEQCPLIQENSDV